MTRKPGRRTNYSKKRQSRDMATTLVLVGVLAIGALVAQTSQDTLIVLGVVLGLTLITVVILMIGAAWVRTKRARAIQMSGVDQMDGFTFEKYVVRLLKRQGYRNVRLTEKYDLGIDVIADKAGERWGIQVKRNHKPTKALSVRQAVTALTHYKCTRAMVVSNSIYTGAAKRLAASNNCVLIDRSALAVWIEDFRRAGNSVVH
ncbi:MAG TPA: restriction endonuclease [Candidatus Saccharimonadales bacterium]|nr:restriction endonuclease [Candidatus Saccharimonadales bacterium]